MHGERDTIAPFGQVEQAHEALADRGEVFEAHRYSSPPHRFQNPENRVDMHGRMEAWMNRWLKQSPDTAEIFGEAQAHASLFPSRIGWCAWIIFWPFRARPKGSVAHERLVASSPPEQLRMRDQTLAFLAHQPTASTQIPGRIGFFSC